jgi:hypothetical protein
LSIPFSGTVAAEHFVQQFRTDNPETYRVLEDSIKEKAKQEFLSLFEDQQERERYEDQL